MSIDYDRLREHLDDFDRAETFHAKCVALEAIRVNAVATARELLALRDGVKQVADDLGANAEYAPNIPAQTAYTEAERLLTDLLEGDNK